MYALLLQKATKLLFQHYNNLQDFSQNFSVTQQIVNLRCSYGLSRVVVLLDTLLRVALLRNLSYIKLRIRFTVHNYELRVEIKSTQPVVQRYEFKLSVSKQNKIYVIIVNIRLIQCYKYPTRSLVHC